MEARAVLTSEADGFARATDLYRSLELPYEEARSRIGAGQLEHARKIVDHYGLETATWAPSWPRRDCRLVAELAGPAKMAFDREVGRNG